MAILINLIILFFLNGLLFFAITEDVHRTLALLYGLLIALLLNVQSYRAINRALNKVYRQASNALTSLMIGEVMKFVLLWAMLIIGYKGLGLALKEMIFSFIFYYIFFIIWNSFPKRA